MESHVETPSPPPPPHPLTDSDHEVIVSEDFLDGSDGDERKVERIDRLELHADLEARRRRRVGIAEEAEHRRRRLESRMPTQQRRVEGMYLVILRRQINRYRLIYCI